MSISTLGYEVEWFDVNSGLLQKFFLRVFLDDNTVELLHETKRQPILRRIHYPDISPKDLFIGNSVTVYNRLLTIKGYANAVTEKYMSEREVHLLCVIPSRYSQKVGEVLELCQPFNLSIGRALTCTQGLSDTLSMSNGDILIELAGNSGIDQENFVSAVQNIDENIGVQFLTAHEIKDLMKNSKSIRVQSTGSLCLIKSHVIADKKAGKLINCIVDAGFNIDGFLTTHFNDDVAEELFGVYQPIYPKYSLMLTNICKAPVLALLISRDENVVQDFRELCGPLEPGLGKVLRPRSLRALFGKNVVENAVHCTDLAEDGDLECKFVFEIIANL